MFNYVVSGLIFISSSYALAQFSQLHEISNYVQSRGSSFYEQDTDILIGSKFYAKEISPSGSSELSFLANFAKRQVGAVNRHYKSNGRKYFQVHGIRYFGLYSKQTGQLLGYALEFYAKDTSGRGDEAATLTYYLTPQLVVAVTQDVTLSF